MKLVNYKFACRITSFLLAATMVFGLAACKPGTKGNSSTGDADSANLAKPSDKATESGYPVVKEPLTLKYWREISPSAVPYIASYAENEAYLEMEKKTGIKIEFIHPSQNQVGEQFNLMVASMDLPDIITGAGLYKGGTIKAINDGIYKDITAYIPKYAPEYSKLIRSDLNLYRIAALNDGRISAFYQVKPKEQTDPPYHGPVIKKDWLDELGLKVPKTIDDWYVMLKAFKEKKNASVPLIFTPSGIEGIGGTFLTAFDLAPGDFYLKGGKTVDSFKIQPGFKEYLTLMNKWYSEGLIAKDFTAQKLAKHKSLFLSDQAGAHTVMAVGDTVIMSEAEGINVVVAPAPRLKEGDQIHFRYPAWGIGGEETVVTTASKYPVEAVRWLNYAYTEEGAKLVNYGVEGKSWTKGPDGKPKFTDYMLKNPKYNPTEASFILKMHYWPKLIHGDLVAHPNMIASPKASELRREWGNEKNKDELYALPPLKLTVEAADTRSQIMGDVNAYANDMIKKFITGAEPLSNFDDYVKQVKALGIEEAIKITQQAYDDFLKIQIK